MKKIKILGILCLIILSQSCKTKYPVVPIKANFGKVSSYAGTCENAQGFCTSLTIENPNATLQRNKSGFKMKLSKNDVSESFIKRLLETKTFIVDKNFYLSKELTNTLFVGKKNNNIKLEVKKGKYPIKVEKHNNAIILWIHLDINFYQDGELVHTLSFDIIICTDC